MRSNQQISEKRRECNCNAQNHQFLDFCNFCGRIICEKEGYGICFGCENFNKKDKQELDYQERATVTKEQQVSWWDISSDVWQTQEQKEFAAQQIERLEKEEKENIYQTQYYFDKQKNEFIQREIEHDQEKESQAQKEFKNIEEQMKAFSLENQMQKENNNNESESKVIELLIQKFKQDFDWKKEQNYDYEIKEQFQSLEGKKTETNLEVNKKKNQEISLSIKEPQFGIKIPYQQIVQLMKGIPCKIVFSKSIEHWGYVWLIGNKKINDLEENRLLGIAYLKEVKEISNENQIKEFQYLFGNIYQLKQTISLDNSFDSKNLLISLQNLITKTTISNLVFVN